jgi:hypothetical protein
VLITSVAGEIVRVKFALWVSAGLAESVTLNVNGVLTTATDGVPVMAPVEVLRLRPVGKVPLVMDHV